MKHTLRNSLIVSLAFIMVAVSILPAYTYASAAPARVVVCAGALPTRLTTGLTIKVSTRVNYLGIRRMPSLDYRRLFDLKPSNTMTVLYGPYCAYNSYFWYITTKKGSGWVREANNSYYFVDPVP